MCQELNLPVNVLIGPLTSWRVARPRVHSKLSLLNTIHRPQLPSRHSWTNDCSSRTCRTENKFLSSSYMTLWEFRTPTYASYLLLRTQGTCTYSAGLLEESKKFVMLVWGLESPTIPMSLLWIESRQWKPSMSESPKRDKNSSVSGATKPYTMLP